MKKKFIDIVSKDKVSGFEEQARKDIANREQLDKEFKEKVVCMLSVNRNQVGL